MNHAQPCVNAVPVPIHAPKVKIKIRFPDIDKTYPVAFTQRETNEKDGEKTQNS